MSAVITIKWLRYVNYGVFVKINNSLHPLSWIHFNCISSGAGPQPWRASCGSVRSKQQTGLFSPLGLQQLAQPTPFTPTLSMSTEHPVSVRHWCGCLGYKVENFLPWRSPQSNKEDKPWRKESSSSHPEVLFHLTLKGRPFHGHGPFLCVLSKPISASPIPDLNIENRGNKYMKVREGVQLVKHLLYSSSPTADTLFTFFQYYH